jgi:hypothetical protein
MRATLSSILGASTALSRGPFANTKATPEVDLADMFDHSGDLDFTAKREAHPGFNEAQSIYVPLAALAGSGQHYPPKPPGTPPRKRRSAALEDRRVRRERRRRTMVNAILEERGEPQRYHGKDLEFDTAREVSRDYRS